MLDRRQYFVREHVGMLKLKDTYDILDPQTQQQIGIAKETTPGWVLGLRFLVDQRMLPKHVAIRAGADESAPPIVVLKRGFTFLRSKVHILDGHGKPLGFFRSKILSLGGGFHVFDAAGSKFAEVKGDWKGWNFRFLDAQGKEVGTVTKKWSGLGKELFTTADNYMISIADLGAEQAAYNVLLLAAGIAIDTVYKERS